MKKSFKVLVSSLLLTSCLPTLCGTAVSVYANENISYQISENTFYDEVYEVSVEVLSDAAIKLTYNDGNVVLLENRDGDIYKNGEFFIAKSSLESSDIMSRSAGWTDLGTTSGRSDRNAKGEAIINYLYGTLLGLVGGGAVGSLVGGIAASFTTTPPGAYSITTIYYNDAQKKFKVVNKYYRNSNFTGYVTTDVKYLNVPV